MAPTLTAVPGQFRVIETVSGQAVAENIIHVVAYDPAPVTYDVTGFGLFDTEGVLIAVYRAAADPILSKAELANSLFAMDIVLSADVAAVKIGRASCGERGCQEWFELEGVGNIINKKTK